MQEILIFCILIEWNGERVIQYDCLYNIMKYNSLRKTLIIFLFWWYKISLKEETLQNYNLLNIFLLKFQSILWKCSEFKETKNTLYTWIRICIFYSWITVTLLKLLLFTFSITFAFEKSGDSSKISLYPTLV